jgi:hypothetical protein
METFEKLDDIHGELHALIEKHRHTHPEISYAINSAALAVTQACKAVANVFPAECDAVVARRGS